MADTLLSFGVEKLWDLIVRESERFQGVEEQFSKLKRDVGKLRSFLEDANAKKHTSAMVINTIKDIQEVVLDAEDIIQTFILKEELGKTSSIKGCVRRFSCVISERRGISFDMEAISKRISDVVDDMKGLGVQQAIVKEGYTQSIEERQRKIRHMFSNDNETILVGLERNVEKLVGYLVEEGRMSQVVSITGMGGIGKTTLARQVFNHETVKSHFQGLAWVCVSQQFTRENVWQTILQQLRPDYKVSEMSEDELQGNLVQVLETQKALIVIDDIWREGDWGMIKPMLPRGEGWKILLTSRNEGVALRADPECFTFKPDCLTDEESWTLFRRIAFPNTVENKVDDEMEEMGKKMIKFCGGLPLAVKVLGGLLAPQYTLSDWKRINRNIKPHIVGGTSFNDRNISSVYHILYLSYEELPVYLKHCFLYLAHFPEDYRIDVEKLCYYWAAEGIPRPKYYEGTSIRDVGDEYIEELVKRNMVLSERDGMSSRYETCKLHDMMREVCLLKAEEENFVQIVDASTRQEQTLTSSASSQLPCKSRRLVIHSWDDSFCIENPKLRSLLKVDCPLWMAPDLCFTRLQLMRVLDLTFVDFKGGKLPSSIGKLIHLTFLSLFRANVTRIPSSMRNLKQLIYLNLVVLDGSPISMPNFLKEMREMTYLYLPRRLHEKVKLELGNLVKLEILKNFSTKHGRVRDLQGMTRLETLSILFRGGCSLEMLSSSLRELKRLKNLTIKDKRDETRTGGFELHCIHLRHLKLRIYMPRLPDEQHLPSHLTTLSLEECRLEEDPMPILEKLLHLKEVTFSIKAFCGRRMVCSRGGFPQLQKLKLCYLKELEEWIVEEGSMPLLHKLEVENCGKLEEWIVKEGAMPLLHTLDITRCEKLNRLSEGSLPSHLTTLSLEECRLEEDPMPILEKLNNLKKVRLWRGSFCGRRMVCSRGGFPQLQKLQFDGFEELEEWIVEEGSMPLLHTLDVSNCGKLTEFPDGLQFITSLKDLSVRLKGEELKNRLSEGHLPSRLTSLYLESCRLEEDPMPILEKLLHLKELILWKGSFVGRRMVCSKGGFPQLQYLKLHELEELEEWTVEEGSMPLLQALEIENCENLEEWELKEGSMPLLYYLDIYHCDNLKEFPDRLRFITSLKNFSVSTSGEEWNNRLSERYLPSRLTTLFLHHCYLEEDPMPILQKLLHLKRLTLSYGSFCGRRMVCSRDGFPQLQRLRLRYLMELEEWIVEEGSMPILQTLYIRDCKKLKELPDGLRFITSLKVLVLSKTGKEWKKRVLQGGGDYYKVQHIPSVEVIHADDHDPRDLHDPWSDEEQMTA